MSYFGKYNGSYAGSWWGSIAAIITSIKGKASSALTLLNQALINASTPYIAMSQLTILGINSTISSTINTSDTLAPITDTGQLSPQTTSGAALASDALAFDDNLSVTVSSSQLSSAASSATLAPMSGSSDTGSVTSTTVKQSDTENQNE
jgi:hypothetical protein